jgi:beta-fructofuranosidase
MGPARASRIDEPGSSPDPHAAGPASSGAVLLWRQVSLAEVYLADGQIRTPRFYPLADGPWRLLARTTGTGHSDFTVEAWALNPTAIRREPLLASQGQDA